MNPLPSRNIPLESGIMAVEFWLLVSRSFPRRLRSRFTKHCKSTGAQNTYLWSIKTVHSIVKGLNLKLKRPFAKFSLTKTAMKITS